MRQRKPRLTKAEEAAAVQRKIVRNALDRADGEALDRFPQFQKIRWAALATEMGVSIHTVQWWARVGGLPKSQALALESRYGRRVVKHEDVIAAKA